MRREKARNHAVKLNNNYKFRLRKEGIAEQVLKHTGKKVVRGSAGRAAGYC